MSIHWFNDHESKQAFDAIEAEVGNRLMHLFPGYQMTHCGFHRSDFLARERGLDEVQVTIHMRRHGEAQMIRTKLEIQDGLRDTMRLEVDR